MEHVSNVIAQIRNFKGIASLSPPDGTVVIEKLGLQVHEIWFVSSTLSFLGRLIAHIH